MSSAARLFALGLCVGMVLGPMVLLALYRYTMRGEWR